MNPLVFTGFSGFDILKLISFLCHLLDTVHTDVLAIAHITCVRGC